MGLPFSSIYKFYISDLEGEKKVNELYWLLESGFFQAKKMLQNDDDHDKDDGHISINVFLLTQEENSRENSKKSMLFV